MKKLLFLLAVLTLAAPAGANASDGRELGGYRFIPTPQVRDPFMTTHFRTATGVSIAAGVDLPLLIVPSEPPDTLLSLKGDYVFIITELEYQYAFNDRWTLRGGAFGASRVGTTGQSLVSQGLSATWGFEMGSTIRLWNNDKWQFAGLVDLRQAKVLVIDLIGYVADIVDGNGEAPSLVQFEDRTTGTAGVSAAWAINEWSGATGYVEFGGSYGDISEQNAHWETGYAYTMDFGQRGQRNIGLAGTLDFISIPSLHSSDFELVTNVGVGVFYTGRDDFNVGAQVQWSKVPLELADVDAAPITIEAVLRYFF